MLVLIHGYNVGWEEAVGTAAAFEAMLNRADPSRPREVFQRVRVILFTWPSDGKALPWVSYKSDRSDARSAAGAVGRAMLKLRDFLRQLGRDVRAAKATERATREHLLAQGITRESEVLRALAQVEGTELCGQKIHLLAHSMGNFVLQQALERVWDFSPGNTLPRMFEHVFMAAADVDDTVLEHGQPMELVHQIGNAVAIYHNGNDMALRVSDYTKGNPDRLGQRGAARPQALHQKIYQVDCSAVVVRPHPAQLLHQRHHRARHSQGAAGPAARRRGTGFAPARAGAEHVRVPAALRPRASRRPRQPPPARRGGPKPPPPGVSTTNTSPGCISAEPMCCSVSTRPSARSTRLMPRRARLAAGQPERWQRGARCSGSMPSSPRGSARAARRRRRRAGCPAPPEPARIA